MVNQNSKTKVLAIIPARKGSKRLKNKNIVRFLGAPMISHTIKHAIKSKYISKLIVSTDCPKIEKISKKLNVEVKKRKKNLATDKSTVNQVCFDLLKNEYKDKFDVVCVLYPTAPLRNTKDINGTIEKLIKSKANFSMAITKFVQLPFKAMNYKNKWLKIIFPKLVEKKSSQFEQFYAGNGSIYCARIKNYLKEKTFYGKKLVGYYMPTYKSIDIDYPEDLKHLNKLV